MTKIVGILNITPDSFSGDGVVSGDYRSNLSKYRENALNSFKGLINSGCEIIDIGAQSTRPDAQILSADEEWNRLDPFLSDAVNLAHNSGVQISIDTYHPEVAKRAISLGVDIINDVSGFADDAMIDAVLESDCKLVVMHSLSVPADRNLVLDGDADVIQNLTDWFKDRIDILENKGIDRERIVVDPGVGFGKTPVQSLNIVKDAHILRKLLNVPIYIGHSRKSFLTLFTNESADKRDALTLAFSALMMQNNVDYLRVHDVKSHIDLRSKLKT